VSTPERKPAPNINAIRREVTAGRQGQRTPAPLSGGSRRTDAPPSPALAGATFAVMLIASTIALVLRGVPEVWVPGVSPMIAPQVAVVAWLPGAHGLLNLVMLIALVASGLVATRRVVDDLVIVPGAVTVVALVLSGLMAFVSSGVRAVGVGLAVDLCLIILTVQATRRLVTTQGREQPPTFPWRTVFALTLTFFPAFAFGRTLFAGHYVAFGSVWSDGSTSLGDIATLWCWVAGTEVIILAGILTSFFPPGRSRSRLAKMIVAILLVAILVIYVAPATVQQR
jgi:hypothetical protein